MEVGATSHGLTGAVSPFGRVTNLRPLRRLSGSARTGSACRRWSAGCPARRSSGCGCRSYWTGHLCDPKHSPITEAEAEVYLARDLQSALAATLRYCPVLATEPESRLAAIVDFTFNLGAGRLQTSTLRRRVNQRDWTAAGQELRRWVYGGGKVLPGLVTRREAEVALIL